MLDESGLETVEYAIVLGLIVAGTVTMISTLGVWINQKFTDIVNETGAGGGTP